MSLVGGTKGQQGLIIYNSPNSELADIRDTGPLLEIRLLEEDGSGICGAVADGGARFLMSSMNECNTASHNRSITLRDNFPEGKVEPWVVLAPSDPRLPLSAFYQPVLSGATASKINNFGGLPLSSYTLDI